MLSRRRFLSNAAAAAALSSRAFALPSRNDIASDPLRPACHLLPPRNWMNDPNGPIVWRGKVHLFYQVNDRVENIALSRQSANEAVEAAHLVLSIIKYVSGATISTQCKSIAGNANCRCSGNTGL